MKRCPSAEDHRRLRFRAWVATSFSCFLLAVAGCTVPRYDAFSARHAIADLPADPTEADSRSLPMFAGRSDAGSPIAWNDLLSAAQWADIIILGEQHDDGVAHAVQRAVVEDVLDRWPRSSLAMEMLERDEQIIVDDYLEGIIDQPTFVRLTFSANWAGEGSWDAWFQPIVDAARERSTSAAPLIAANAPRRYVRLARTDGYQRLRSLSPERRRMFDFPRSRHLSHYRDRFGHVMSHAHGDDVVDSDHAEQRIDAAFRGQVLWDATMAGSISSARPNRSAKVVHLVGQFHSDFDGGLVQELRAWLPHARILTVSMQRRWRSEMSMEDAGRADIIIYTGERPPRPDPDEPEEVEEDIEE